MFQTGGIQSQNKGGTVSGPSGGYQDPENKDQRQKLRTRMEPTRRCVVHTSDTNPVSSRQEESQTSVFIRPQTHLFSCGVALTRLPSNSRSTVILSETILLWAGLT